MNYKIIASGSKGNALAICEGYLTLLIDCGVPFKSIQGIKPDFVLLTHEHGDHLKIRTIKKVMQNYPLCKFVIAPFLYQKLRDAGVSARRIVVCDAGDSVELKKGNTEIKASTFSLVHDVPNVGWKLSLGTKQATSDKSSDAIRMMYATDTSEIDHIEMPGMDYYFLEANYEDDELEARMAEKIRNGEYSYEARVRESHLSKAQADKWLANNAGENSRFIYMHQHVEEGEQND